MADRTVSDKVSVTPLAHRAKWAQKRTAHDVGAHVAPPEGELGWRCHQCLRVFLMEIDPGFIVDTFPVKLRCVECCEARL